MLCGFMLICMSQLFAQKTQEEKRQELERKKQELEQQRQELESRREELNKQRDELITIRNQYRLSRASSIDSTSLIRRLSTREIVLFSAGELKFPQSDYLINYKGNFHLDIVRFGYYPNIHVPIGFRLNLATGILYKSEVDKVANQSNLPQMYRFESQLNYVEWSFGMKFLKPYSLNLVNPFLSADIVRSSMQNYKIAHPLNESGKLLANADRHRILKRNSFIGYRVKSGVEFSIQKLFKNKGSC